MNKNKRIDKIEYVLGELCKSLVDEKIMKLEEVLRVHVKSIWFLGQPSPLTHLFRGFLDKRFPSFKRHENQLKKIFNKRKKEIHKLLGKVTFEEFKKIVSGRKKVRGFAE